MVETGQVEQADQKHISNAERLPDETADATNDATPNQPAAFKYITIYGNCHTHQQKDDAEGVDGKTGIHLRSINSPHKKVEKTCSCDTMREKEEMNEIKGKGKSNEAICEYIQ